jgi:hypothetical protein
MAIAVAALVVALVAATFSWRATSRAGDVADRLDALAAKQTGAPAVQTTIEPTPANEPTEPSPPTEPTEPAGSAPTLNAQTQYKVRYTDEALKISARCNDTVYLDLDEPRVQVDSLISELTYSDGCGSASAKLRLRSGIEGSEVQSPAVTPPECAEQIRTSPLPQNGDQPVRRGQVYCIKTSLDAARNSGISWKMIILSVSATAQDGTVTLKASAWDIPN